MPFDLELPVLTSGPSRFVRQSHYRHVYGQSSKKEACYDK